MQSQHYFRVSLMFRNLQPCPDIYIASGDLGRADKNVTTVSTRTINANRVLASVSLRAVQSDCATLVAVAGIGRPRGLVPSVLEAFSDLGNCQRRNGQREESGLSEHCSGSSLQMLGTKS